MKGLNTMTEKAQLIIERIITLTEDKLQELINLYFQQDQEASQECQAVHQTSTRLS